MGKFANILGYHAKYFSALAYWQLAQHKYTTATKAAKGMGQAVGYLNRAVAEFNACKVYVTPIGGTYQQNWEKKLQEASELCAKAQKENNSVYYELAVKAESIEVPNPKNYVKLVDCSAELNAVPELDNHLRHLVPPAVRAMQ